MEEEIQKEKLTTIRNKFENGKLIEGWLLLDSYFEELEATTPKNQQTWKE